MQPNTHPREPDRAHQRRRGLTLLAAVASAILALPAVAQASTYNVTLTTDASGTCAPAGPCTLRQAVASAQAGDTVSLAAGTYSLSAAAGGAIAIGHAITIAGPGNGAAASTVIDAQGASRVFTIDGPQAVTIQDVTLTHGQASDANGGGAIFARNGGTVNLDRVVLDSDSSTTTGGAITESDDTLNLTDVALTNDTADRGGAIYAYSGTVSGTGVLFAHDNATHGGGALYVSATVSLTNASLAANAGGTAGGAIYADDASVSLVNDTFGSDNTATGSPGGNDVFNAAAGTVAATNTIFGLAPSGSDCAGYEFGSLSHVIEGDDSCTSPTGSAVQSNADARLMPLGNYSGPTSSIGIEPSSPALGAADAAACPTQDERGFDRTGVACDIGAFQRQIDDPAPPYARTDPATDVGDTTATLHALVNASGDYTSYSFQYGTDGTFSSSTPSVSIGHSAADQAVSATIGPLTPATDYQYRVVATNNAGRAVAFSRSFHTPANEPPACTSATISVAAGSAATLPLTCTDPDGETVTLAITSPPSHGALGSIDQAARTVTYTPQAGYSGTDTVGFTATDDLGAPATPAAVTVNVTSGDGGASGGSTGGGGSNANNGSGANGNGGGSGPQPPPGCNTPVSFGLIKAHGCFTHTGNEYRSTGTITINGLAVTPDKASTIVLDPVKGEIWTDNGGAAIALGPFTLYSGPFAWTPPASAPSGGAMVAQFDPNRRVLIGGFPIAGHATVSLVQGGASVELALRLPDVFNGLTGQTTLQTTEDHGFSLSSLQLSADDLVLGPVHLDNVSLSYDATSDTWSGGATVYLPTPNLLGIIGGLSLQHGQFQSATAGVDDLNVPLANGLFLQRIQLSLGVNPIDIGGGIAISVGPVLPLAAAADTKTAPKPGEELVRIDGNFDWRFSNPWRLHVDGSVKIVDANLASAYFDYLSSGSMDFGGKIELGLPDTSDPDHQPVYFAGTLNGWVDGSRAFDAEAAATLRVMGADVAGAQLLVSNIGIAGCGQIGWLQGGFGYRWADHQLAIMGPWSCDIGPYRPTGPSASAAAVRGLRFPRGAGAEVVKVIGAAAPPQLRLAGPGGEQVATTPDGRPVINDHFVVLTDPQSNTTYIAIRHAAGAWRMTIAGGSVVREVLTAATLTRPRVVASVAGRGHARVLRYAVTAQSGDRVQFAEVAPDAHRVLATVGAGRGVVRFTPADGPGGPRRIEAIVLRGGLPESAQTVAHYVAPAPARPARPGGVRARHRGTTLVVSWRPVAGGVRGYAVRVAIRDGATRLLFAPAGTTRLVLPAVLPSDAATITVAGIARDGMTGASARVALSPVRVHRG